MGSNALHKLYKGSTLIWQEATGTTIYYTSRDGNVVNPHSTGVSVFGANIVSNTYSGGQGVITFDGPVTSIGTDAFYGCNKLTSIDVPDSVTSIGYYAFNGCSNLSSITLSTNLTSIGSSVFGKSGLQSINIPSSVTSIGDGIFYWCSHLSSITGTYSGISSDNRCIGINGKLVGFAPSGLTDYTIPSMYTSIGSTVFAYCDDINQLDIPNTITSIGSSAFLSCHFSALTIPDSVITIEGYAFERCTFDSGITFGSGLTTIRANAFNGAYVGSYQEIRIPSGVTYIGNSALAFSNTPLAYYIYATTPPTLGTSAFPSPLDCGIFVPSASLNAYKTATNWSEYADNIYPMS